MATGSAVRAESLTKIYRSGGGQVIVFQNLNVDVQRGERLAIIGASGAGKSTLLQLLGGLDRPTSGAVRYDTTPASAGRNPGVFTTTSQTVTATERSGVSHEDPSQDIVRFSEQKLADFRNKHIGFVWQNPSLLPEFSALENVMMPLLIAGVPPDQAAKSASERLSEVGLANRATHRAGELSGGEQQRVALARALVSRPQVLLADEPTGSLDFRTGDTIIARLDELHRKHALTSIFVTHNLFFASRCDRVLQLSKGGLHPVSRPDLLATREVKDATRLDGGTYV